MTTSLSKFAMLVQQIANKTEAEELEWSEPLRDVFETRIGSTTVRVTEDSSDFDPERDPDYYISVSRGGQWLDAISDADLKKHLSNPFLLMRSLYRGARRTARGVSSLLDEINAELDKMDGE
jgi:hypothetical protein